MAIIPNRALFTKKQIHVEKLQKYKEYGRCTFPTKIIDRPLRPGLQGGRLKVPRATCYGEIFFHPPDFMFRVRKSMVYSDMSSEAQSNSFNLTVGKVWGRVVIPFLNEKRSPAAPVKAATDNTHERDLASLRSEERDKYRRYLERTLPKGSLDARVHASRKQISQFYRTWMFTEQTPENAAALKEEFRKIQQDLTNTPKEKNRQKDIDALEVKIHIIDILCSNDIDFISKREAVEKLCSI